MIPLIKLDVESDLLLEIKKNIDRVVNSNLYILGKELESFENKFAKAMHAAHAIGVGNGTDALRLALRALGIKSGDKVLTVSLTSPFTVIPIVEEGATPVFCDVDKDTWTLNVGDCLNKMDKNVKAIMPVHIYGNPANMREIRSFAKKYKLKIVEDACQAHGATIGSTPVGNFGDAAAFSFYPTKNLGGFGDAGMVITNSGALAKRIRLLRHGGQTKRFWHLYKGTNSRLDEIQAAVLTAKLSRLKRHNIARADLVKRYKNRLKGLPIIFQAQHKEAQSVNHLCVIKTEKRNALHKFLLERQIMTDVYYPHPVHRQPAFRQFFKESLPVTENLSRQLLAIPLFPTMTNTDQEIVIDAICDFFKN